MKPETPLTEPQAPGAFAGSHPLSFVLASASPRRVELLKQVGIVPSRIHASHVDETPLPGELPRALAVRLAKLKATAVSDDQATDELVLAADTVVACGRRILPKAEGRAQAEQCLLLLSGRRHRVMSAVALARQGSLISLRLVETRVAFKVLAQAEISAYLDSEEWRGKAGGYAIQGRASLFVRWIEGSYSNVVGLPLYETAALLEGAGLAVFTRRV